MKKYTVLYKIMEDFNENEMVTFAYKPCQVIQIDEKGGHFYETCHGELFKYSDSKTYLNEKEFCISNVYTKKELLEKFEVSDIDEAKSKLFDLTNETSEFMVGYYDEETDSVTIEGADQEEENICFVAEEMATILNMKTINEKVDMINQIMNDEELQNDRKINRLKYKGLAYMPLEAIKILSKVDNVENINSVFKQILDQIDLLKREDGMIENNTSSNKVSSENIFSLISKIQNKLQSDVIGQDEAKKATVNAVITNEQIVNTCNKDICLLIGPTGSGKTLIAKTVAEAADKGLCVVDTTQLSIPGHVGNDISSYLEQLYESCGNDLYKAEHSILVFDEIDKPAVNNKNGFGKAIYNTLLGILSGNKVILFKNHQTKSAVVFDPSHLTIIATGAFADLVKNKDSNTGEYKSTNMGFGSRLSVNDKEDIEYPIITEQDLVDYGKMPPELVGRISSIIQLKGHTKTSLYNILTKSNLSPLKDEEMVFEAFDVKLTYNEGYLTEVATKAFDLKKGARSLNTIVKHSLLEAKSLVISNPGKYRKVILTRETVFDNSKFEIVEKIENKEQVKRLCLTK